MDRRDHGAARAGKVTASIAHVIMRGSQSAWETLVRELWADDGSGFAAQTHGARAHGHIYENVGISKFWERHPEYEIDDPKIVKFHGTGYSKKHRYRQLIACSPDFGVRGMNEHIRTRIGGGEVKSPVSMDRYETLSLFTDRNLLPYEHADQVHFSLWCTGWPRWWYIVHFEDRYSEVVTGRDAILHTKWVQRFLPRLNAFIDFYLEGKAPVRDKLPAAALAAMLRK